MLLVVVLLAGGCGGDDGGADGDGGDDPVSLSDPGAAPAGSPRLDMATFRRRANRFCSDGAARVNRIGRRLEPTWRRTGQIPWELIDQMQAEARRLWERQKAMRPPAEVEDRWLRLIRVETMDDLMDRAEQAIERRDFRAYLAVALGMPRADSEDARIVRELRIPACKPRTMEELRRIR